MIAELRIRTRKPTKALKARLQRQFTNMLQDTAEFPNPKVFSYTGDVFFVARHKSFVLACSEDSGNLLAVNVQTTEAIIDYNDYYFGVLSLARDLAKALSPWPWAPSAQIAIHDGRGHDTLVYHRPWSWSALLLENPVSTAFVDLLSAGGAFGLMSYFDLQKHERLSAESGLATLIIAVAAFLAHITIKAISRRGGHGLQVAYKSKDA